MEPFIAALKKANTELARSPNPKTAILQEALDQVKRIDTNAAELVYRTTGHEHPRYVMASDVAVHLIRPTPEGYRGRVELAKLHGALQTRKRLPKAGKELKTRTTIILGNLDWIKKGPNA